MKLGNKVFTVELTETEIRCLTDMLHEAFCGRKTDYEEYKNGKDNHDYYALMADARQMRNFFAGLINRSYMGEDA